MTTPYETGVLLGVKQQKQQRSACLMALPDDASLERIRKLKADLDLEGVDWLPSDRSTAGPHATIRFWRPNRDVPKKITDYLDRKLKGVSVKAEGKEWKIMGKDDTLAVVLESDELMDLQKEIDDKLQEMGVEPSGYPEYLPHVSIAERATETPDEPPKIKIRFDTWLLNTRHKDEGAAMKSAYALGFMMGKEAAQESCPAGHERTGGRCKRIRRYGGTRSLEDIVGDAQRDIAAEGGNGNGAGNGAGNGGGNGNGGM